VIKIAAQKISGQQLKVEAIKTTPNGETSSTPQMDKQNVSETLKESDAVTAANAVLKPSVAMPAASTRIRGVDFNEYSSPITVKELTSHFSRTGFQASSIGRAIEIINNMVYSPST
jgi:hypothetical protein